MEYRTVATKLPSNEFTLFKAFCEKKGITLASLMKELILRELKIPTPHTIAGRNKLLYDRKTDVFTWSVELDSGDQVQILRNVSPSFVQDLKEILMLGLEERDSFIHRERDDSVPVPSGILRGKRP
jgi:hypothetical protein